MTYPKQNTRIAAQLWTEDSKRVTKQNSRYPQEGGGEGGFAMSNFLAQNQRINTDSLAEQASGEASMAKKLYHHYTVCECHPPEIGDRTRLIIRLMNRQYPPEVAMAIAFDMFGSPFDGGDDDA